MLIKEEAYAKRLRKIRAIMDGAGEQGLTDLELREIYQQASDSELPVDPSEQIDPRPPPTPMPSKGTPQHKGGWGGCLFVLLPFIR